MVNKILLDYFKKYSPKYKLEELKQKALSSGYPQYDIYEAANILANQRNSQVVESIVLDSSGSKWMKFAGICGIILAFVSILSLIFSYVLYQNQSVLFISISILVTISILSLIFFFYGFVRIGKRYNRSLLRVMSWMFIFCVFVFAIFLIILTVSPQTIGKAIFQPVMSSLLSSSFSLGALFSVLGIILVVLILIFIVLLVIGILFFAGLVLVRESVSLAKITGILGIIGMCTLFLGIGFLILGICFILEIILLFSEANKKV